MRLLKRRDKKLVNSELHDECSFFSTFSNDIKSAKHKVIIESPFITKRRVGELAPLCRKIIRKGVVVTIYTRNTSHHDAGMREQSILAIDTLKSAGVNVVTCDDMRHRKLAIVDSLILWEGSLNMLSHSNSREVMRRSVSKKLCDEMLRFTGIGKAVR